MGEKTEALARFSESLNILNNIDDPLSMAIAHNNKSVIEIRNSNFKEAFKSAKAAITLVEPFIFEKIKTHSEDTLKQDAKFQEKLQILLIAYKNFCAVQKKINNRSYAQTVQNHLQKMADKLLNKDSKFSESFQRKTLKKREENNTKGRKTRNSNFKSEQNLQKKPRPFTSHSNATSKLLLVHPI